MWPEVQCHHWGGQEGAAYVAFTRRFTGDERVACRDVPLKEFGNKHLCIFWNKSLLFGIASLTFPFSEMAAMPKGMVRTKPMKSWRQSQFPVVCGCSKWYHHTTRANHRACNLVKCGTVIRRVYLSCNRNGWSNHKTFCALRLLCNAVHCCWVK